MDKNAPILYLENQLCFPLYAASRLTTKIYAPLLKELALTYPQYLVLLVLWQFGESSVNEVGQRLLLESNTLTPLLKRLEEKKLVKRNRADTDERKVMVNLTDKGSKLKEKASLIPCKIAEAFDDETISESEILEFQSTLHKLLGLLKNKTLKSNQLPDNLV